MAVRVREKGIADDANSTDKAALHAVRSGSTASQSGGPLDSDRSAGSDPSPAGAARRAGAAHGTTDHMISPTPCQVPTTSVVLNDPCRERRANNYISI